MRAYFVILVPLPIIASDIKPKYLNDDLIGHTLDTFYQESISALYQYLRAKVIDHLKLKNEIKFLEIGTDKDHVHFLLQSVPMYSVNKLVQMIKRFNCSRIV